MKTRTVLFAVALTACATSSNQATMEEAAADGLAVAPLPASAPMAEAEAMPQEPMWGDEVAKRVRRPMAKPAGFAQAADHAAPDADVAGGEGAEGAEAGEDPARRWFPEAFLWAPRVETGDDGVATIEVRVPDQLTTWRVLGLAHDRDGQQTGAVHTFDTRLPVYVEPVVPGWLHAGDVVELPVQAVNTTDDRVEGRLVVTAEGPLSGGGEATVALSPGGSDVRRIRVSADGAGLATVHAALGDHDAAARQIPVVPAGRPVVARVGGTLSSERALRVDGPVGADPRTQELTVRVFPGPLAVLQAELERATAGGDGAYAFALAGAIDDLGARVGVEVDAAAIRKLQVVAWQRVVRLARAPDHGAAADLLLALRDVDDHALAEQLRPRLVHTLVQGQRGDGTWARQDRGTLQQVVVQTAIGAMALPDGEVGARIRAAGAVERHAREVTDPYTAAVVLASGLADEALRDRLVAIVLEALVPTDDGGRTVEVPAARNAWGGQPSKAEVLAWTALALADRPEAGDLVAELMGGWDARRGFGAGPADVVALEAVARLLPGADAPVEVALLRDGREVARSAIDPKQPLVPAVLVAPGGGAYALRLDGEAPGLAFTATLASWVPWTGHEGLPGVEAEVALGELAVGREGQVTIRIAGPSGVAVTVEQGLPAGAIVDEAALASLSGVLRDWSVETDRVRLTTRPFQPGEVLEVAFGVQPAFAGTFQTAPLALEADGRRAELAPATWRVGSGYVASKAGW